MRFPLIASLPLLLILAACGGGAGGMPGPATSTTPFGGGGMITRPLSSAAFDMVELADGRLIVAGSRNRGIGDEAYVFALHHDGFVDTSFGVGGEWTDRLGGADKAALAALTVQPDGKIVAAGTLEYPGATGQGVILRLLPNGTLDTTFAGGGYFVLPVLSIEDVLTDVHVQADGKILATGHATDGIIACRLLPSGAVDASFGGNGILTLYRSGETQLMQSGLQSDGKIVLVGESYDPTTLVGVGLALRLTVDGALDGTFGTGGYREVDVAPGLEDDSLFGLTIRSDDTIVATGSAGLNTLVVGLTRDGALDGSFGTAGALTYAATNPLHSLSGHRVIPRADGSMYVLSMLIRDIGLFTGTPADTGMHVARITAAGALDPSLSGALAVVRDAGIGDLPWSALLRSTGQLLMVGLTSADLLNLPTSGSKAYVLDAMLP